MSNTIHIRKVDESDFDIIYNFINELEREVFDKKRQQKIFLENISNSKNIYLVATENGQVIAYLSCHIQNLLHHNGAIGEIQEMFVDQNNRGLGIGKILVDRLKVLASEKNVLQLEVTSNIKRKSAHNFYQKQQFKESHKKFVFCLT